MRVNRTYSLDVKTVNDLNAIVSAKHRSRYVDDAIKNKLYGVGAEVSSSTGRQLVAAAMHRDDISTFLKRCIANELGIEQ